MSIHPRVLNTVSLEFSSVARAKANRGETMISLGLGEPGFATPSLIITAAYDSMLKGETRYSSPWGCSSLLGALKKRISDQINDDVNDGHIIVTLGAKQALSLSLMSILEPQDEVLVLTPCYVSFIPQILMAEKNAKVVEVSLTKEFDIDFDILNKAITNKTKAIIVNYPNNPTGKICNASHQEKLVRLCSVNGIYLISDEIYSNLLVGKHTFSSFGEFWKVYDRIFVIDGFSKSYSMTGWRIGYLAGPTDQIKRIVVIQQHLNTNIPVFIQRGAEAALNLSDKHLISYNQQITENEKFLYQKLQQIYQLQYTRSQGGMFAFIDISNLKIDSDSFCTGLLQLHHVAATPGKVFGHEWDNFIRVSLGGPTKDFKLGITKLITYSKEL